MKVNIVSQKSIKPFTPTPQNLRSYKISYFDELNPPMNIGIILFYPSKPEKISHLEESLAKTLPKFYPLAGRYIKKDRLVDCSDEGAEFVQAEAVDVKLLDVVEKSTTLEQLRGLLPPQFYRLDEAVTDPLLSVQITGFQCGGLAIGISISHRIFDMYSVAAFITAWSRNANNPGGESLVTPSFDGPLLFPLKANQACSPQIVDFPDIVVKKFVFNKQAIASLRSMLKPHSSGKPISRVRVVSALMSKALIGMDRAKHGISRASVIVQAFNIRERTIPALPKYSCGNFAITLPNPRIAANETKDIGIQYLVDVIGEATEKTIHDCSKILVPGADRVKIIDGYVADLSAILKGGEVSSFFFTDCSKFGFYRADFGWGKPVWASIGPMLSDNMIVLMENKEDDGIEAWLHLKEDDMSCFEQDEDIRLFATSDGKMEL